MHLTRFCWNLFCFLLYSELNSVLINPKRIQCIAFSRVQLFILFFFRSLCRKNETNMKNKTYSSILFIFQFAYNIEVLKCIFGSYFVFKKKERKNFQYLPWWNNIFSIRNILTLCLVCISISLVYVPIL